jgi:hypothetical protein
MQRALGAGRMSVAGPVSSWPNVLDRFALALAPSTRCTCCNGSWTAWPNIRSPTKCNRAPTVLRPLRSAPGVRSGVLARRAQPPPRPDRAGRHRHASVAEHRQRQGASRGTAAGVGQIIVPGGCARLGRAVVARAARGRSRCPGYSHASARTSLAAGIKKLQGSGVATRWSFFSCRRQGCISPPGDPLCGIARLDPTPGWQHVMELTFNASIKALTAPSVTPAAFDERPWRAHPELMSGLAQRVSGMDSNLDGADPVSETSHGPVLTVRCGG